MRIEKNIKTPLDDIRIVSGEKKTLMFRIKQWVLSHRLNTRQKLLLNPINTATVVTFLPLALGFSQFLIYTSRSSLSQNSGSGPSDFWNQFGKCSSFFDKNLPVFTHFKPKLNFETFEYIAKSNHRTSAKSNQNNLMFGQSNFLVTLKKSDSFGNKKFNGLSCDFYLLPSGNFISQPSSMMSLARKLDELPAYVQGLKLTQEETKNIITSDSIFLVKDNVKTRPVHGSQPDNKQMLDPGKSKHKTLSFSATSKTSTKLSLITPCKTSVEKTNSSELNIRPNQFYKDRLDFYSERKKFTSELQTLFTEKNISCVSNDLLNSNLTQNQIEEEFSHLNFFLNKNSEVTDDFLIETILQELEKTSISQDFPNFRFMSGYCYPDMTSEELNWFYSGSHWKQKEFVGETDSFQASSKNYNFRVKNFPKFSIETTQVSLRNPELTSSFYTGPALLLDSKRAFDWRISSKENLRSWFHSYLSPLNPLIQPLENFFGVYNSPKGFENRQIQDFSDRPNRSLFSFKWTPAANCFFDAIEESVSNFSPSIMSFHVLSDVDEAKMRFLKTLDVDTSKSKNQERNQFVTVPILQLQHPFGSSGDAESDNLQNYSSYFSFKSKGNPDYQFSTDFFDRKNFVTKYASGSYTKTASVYSQTIHSTQVNADQWEPLTATSWLIITQFSFAFFIFHVLKGLADNYGRELIGYLLDLVASLGILDDSLKQEIEILLGRRDKGFRVVLQSRKTFKDIVGIEKLLPEIYEVVWFLRNSARDFALSKTLPRGILLTGPPGTGKTLLVQAIAGEAQVPVVVLSGSSLIEPGESGAVKLEMVFQEARELAPCIVFIDEIDTLAHKRNGVVQNPMGSDELVESLTSFQKPQTESTFEQMERAREKREREKEGDTTSHTSSQEEQLSLLTQFLIELDGIQGRDGVIVIGATNRPEVLDPALLRPGRLEKILQVGLPGHQKRVEILQFYGQGLGYQPDIPWNYLGARTAGFTAADLATLMNESTIKAILNQTKHTIETIEHGIDRLTTSESEKYTVLKTQTKHGNNKGSSLTISSKMAILRLAYYQAGKIVLSSILETHPKSVVACLWPRRPTIRSAQIATNLQNSVFEFARLSEITDRLIGCYGGKAAEVLFVQQFSSSKYAQLSTLGFEDLLFAQKLVYCILEKWSLYSKKTHIQQTVRLAPNMNVREFREIPEKLDLYAGIVETIETPPMSKALETQTNSIESKKNTQAASWNAQIYYSIPWWQQQISGELEFVEKNFTNWSRLYLSNPEQNERNPEWLPPNEFYHSSSALKNVKKAYSNLQKRKTPLESTKQRDVLPRGSEVKERYLPQKTNFSWNEVALLTRDYPVHSLILQSFNKALVILNQNRELLDRLVIELLYREILRQPEIESLLREFNCNRSIAQEDLTLDPSSKSAPENPLLGTTFGKEKKQKFEILESSWGSHSRKAIPRWIDFAEFSGETT